MMKFGWITFFLALLCLSVVLTYAVRRIALKKMILDIPNDRSSHKTPVPRGGGLGFTILFYVALCVLWWLHIVSTTTVMILLGGVAIAIVGYLDDLYTLPSRWRIVVHLLVALWCVFWLHGASSWHFGAFNFSVPVLVTALSVIWVIWLINLYNFMDGIDGIATVEGVFVAVVAGVLLYVAGSSLGFVCFALAAVLLGFLPWNWAPAKIFMGDVASGFLGYIFAALALISNAHQTIPFPVWWLVLGVFLCDATYTLLKRMWQRQQWYSAHCDHAYQNLARHFGAHAIISSSVLLFNIVILLPLSLLYLRLQSPAAELGYLLAFFILMGLIWCYALKKSNKSRGN